MPIEPSLIEEMKMGYSLPALSPHTPSPHPSTPSPLIPTPPPRNSTRTCRPPTCLKEYAASSPAWQEAMVKKFQALKANHTWDIVPLPPNKKRIPLEVSDTSQGFLISQTKFTTNLLSEFNCPNFSSVTISLDSSLKLTANMGEALSDSSGYRRIIEKLNILQHTRPDIAFSVQHLSHFLQAPQIPHMMAALHVLRYLSNALDLGILLPCSSNLDLKVFFDSNWAVCAQSRRSVSGYYITLSGCPVS
ncbi:PREDICTED: uncharacterized protein LOC109237968 [Nicotiana attenuata]|uniref:uncharacterized protein LOC109237968 n=1 Tax=Nicotiana attenuata TaxID=49451 RepID=UPI000904A24A|nr:PREDICTED: uncharacterized protein LOC109237968 [Nicotiana attenuata]